LESQIIKKSQENANSLINIFHKQNVPHNTLYFQRIKIKILKRKFKQWWSTISPVSTKRTITSIFITHWTQKTTQYDVGNILPGLIHTNQNVTGVNGGSL